MVIVRSISPFFFGAFPRSVKYGFCISVKAFPACFNMIDVRDRQGCCVICHFKKLARYNMLLLRLF
jgi:hypothetical protein